jgi:hypothetical protein
MYILCPIAYDTDLEEWACYNCGIPYEHGWVGGKPRSYTYCDYEWIVCGKCFYNGLCAINKSEPELPEAKIGCMVWTLMSV